MFGVGGACASTAVMLAVNIEAAAGAGTGDAIDEPGGRQESKISKEHQGTVIYEDYEAPERKR